MTMARSALSIALSLTVAQAAVASECSSQQQRSYQRLADLPTDAVKALGFKMAEKGRPFQSSDIRGWPAGLPSARFVSAMLRYCTLTIKYELGGLYKRWETVTLVKSGETWTRAPGGAR